MLMVGGFGGKNLWGVAGAMEQEIEYTLLNLFQSQMIDKQLVRSFGGQNHDKLSYRRWIVH